ncbi:hypothetical protein ASPWEDRAFT_66181 [Aspergillus wentii DTO 134E9]|uniref:Chromatin modification-related protein n=1 Tax=Aspergillus wentii DTO 134E9 TaxID=1073089 RepID=A0A1L9RWR6_ASPWE|nr:uncharacterized protein ASPWEDRAFT_66181 [Aspergillus wentii DTO 134E9]OJJ39324.1 hypothetical protein ASPWEDRAFT_66181 [Aspergillus wentii DTO 134E9]
MAELNDESGGVILDGPFDPDAQATVTDYIDYTEFLPADLIRSLTLIRGLDERYTEAAQGVHDLTKTYGQLPDLAADTRPNSQTLRKDISSQLDRAINARESAYAEACRLYDVVDRHFNRLGCIKQKLEALPKPASRDPTPPSNLPNNKRARATKKGEDGAQPTTRITLRLDSQENAGAASSAQKSRSRRSVIAAEHLADFNPDSPIASTEHSDVEADSKTEVSPVDPDTAKSDKAKKEKQNRRSRPPGMGTNAHSAVAGISTSNALAMLQPPPEDARPGTQDMPWLRLTEWEMTKLRKKMKKNAVWQPSEVMIHRELALRGRGWEAYRAAKAEAEAGGTPFIDCDDIANTYIPGKLTRRSEATKDQLGTTETKLSNRGMKLNEAKKLKRENLAREQAAAAAAAAAAEAGKRDSASSKSQLPSPTGQSVPASEAQTAEKPTRASKKRKLEEESPVVDAVPPTQPDDESRTALRSSAKRRKNSKETPSTTPMEASASASNASVNTTATATATDAAATAADPSANARKSPPLPSPTESKPVAAAPTAAEPETTNGETTSTPPVARPPSRRLSIAAAAEPALTVSAQVAGRDLRRKSATPARRTPVPESARAASVSAPTRRRKRPAPGPISSGQNGGAAVSYGRRKAKPTKKRIGVRENGQNQDPSSREDVRIDEDGVLEEIDPNEPRYCLCGDISFGTMICCENQDCDREWFHLDCVGLSEVPSRTAKWYCPACRVRFNKGVDGIVKIGTRR